MKTVIIFSGLVFFFNYGFAQRNSQIEEMRLSLKINPPRTYSEAKNNKNEYEVVISALFLGYKQFISSQDDSNCSFTPSCSEYAVQAIKKQGFILGLFNFFDRFARCNGLSPEDYAFHKKAHLLIDPVRDINHEIIRENN
jgi:putative membrane protein insertion efficiency factor